MIKIKTSEINIQNELINNINNLSAELIKDKSLLQSIYKTEILAGVAGGCFAFILFIFYYYCNGLKQKSNKKINK